MSLSPEERQREKERHDEHLANIAFEDYYMLGPGRSIADLFERYKAQAQDPMQPRPPTRHRPHLTRWRRQYNWDERCAKRDTQVKESERRDYEQIRSLRLDDLMDMTEKAIKRLTTLLEDDDVPERVQLDAVKTLLDRVGLSEKRTAQQSTTHGGVKPPPSPDASEEELRGYWEYLKQQV